MAKKRRRTNRKAEAAEKSKDTRKRGRKPYPVLTFDQAMQLGRGIVEHGAGHPMQRTTLLKKMKLGDSQSTRQLISASVKYGITLGGHKANEIKLTEIGRTAVDPEVAPKRQAEARFQLAINSVEPFAGLYEKYKGGKLPAAEVMRDTLDELDEGDRAPCVDVFLSNANTVGLLQNREGASYLLAIEECSGAAPRTAGSAGTASPEVEPDEEGVEVDTSTEDFDRVCFFIAPIGEEGTEHRCHSDAMLASFVEPALAEHGLKVIRADKITKPGMISAQIVEYILRSKLVVADLSFHNPNVFYELCLRHVTGRPAVHISRKSDRIPFDVGNFRTVQIDIDTVYGMLANLDTYKAEVATQIRQALAGGSGSNNPISTFCPTAQFTWNGDEQ